MKTRYLAYVGSDGASSSLTEISGAKWYEILSANKALPDSKKRWFIRDVIIDGPESDALVIEVTREEYMQWKAEEQQRYRNSLHAKAYKHISFDFSDELSILEILPFVPGVEEQYLASKLTEELFRASAKWRPWAPALLLYCMSGKTWPSATAWLSEYLSVCIRTARKNKAEFKKFIIGFLS